MNGFRQKRDDHFVRRENVRRYEKQLKAETDEAKRKVVGELLAAERKKQADDPDPTVWL